MYWTSLDETRREARQDSHFIALRAIPLPPYLACLLFAKLSTLFNSFKQVFFFFFFVVVLIALISILLLEEIPLRLVDVEARIRLVSQLDNIS